MGETQNVNGIDMKDGQRVYLELNREFQKVASKYSWQNFTNLVAFEREVHKDHIFSPVLAYTLMKATLEQGLREECNRNNIISSSRLPDALDELYSISYTFFKDKISTWDYTRGVYFDRYIKAHCRDLYRLVEFSVAGYNSKSKKALEFYKKNDIVRLDEQYNYDIDDDNLSHISCDTSNNRTLMSPEEYYISQEEEESKQRLNSLLERNGENIEEEKAFYFTFVNSFLGGPNHVPNDFYQKEVEFFFGSEGFEMSREDAALLHR
ncbi:MULTISPECIES: hypothetical protein [Pseudobutyrivibrio]|uniref:Uncharacterized protein n=1 Tax=Pseudobutyrivibrio ruminis TaxID=46206 RepID=A0A2G3E7G0_9FIRM|nr:MULTISPECIES: hypothetical protein [Pseudobutyrivibrio]PHU34321.1 hypothetical protein CSX01_10910 [Pseudobutyrivibrio ruminis]PHU39110.1 hypothetical protein CSX00_12355 [Pseudobutyrivibrio ruminis]SCX95836.1 hypothetical protein SAMN05660668_00901 [Pseudobutyrivibrio sp. AR14]